MFWGGRQHYHRVSIDCITFKVVFLSLCSLSPLFDASISISDYYNNSEQSNDININTGLPYGYFHYPMEGLKDGYPLVVSAGISEKRAHQTLKFIEYGGLLNKDATESLSLKVQVVL